MDSVLGRKHLDDRSATTQRLRRGLLMFANYMLPTWIAASFLALAAGAIGYFTVIRRSVFAAHALPLSAFPGGAAAVLTGIDPMIGLLGFAFLGVVFVQQSSRLGPKDLAIGLLLSSFLALGALLLSLTGAYAPAVYALLFGEVLGIPHRELLPTAAVSLLVLAVTVLSFRPLLLQSAAADLATICGINRAGMEWLFLGLLAIVTATALPVVGTLLVFTLLVAPAAAAQRLSAHPARAFLISIALAELLVWSAIALSYWSNWPLGFFVGTLGAVLFVVLRGGGLLPSPSGIRARLSRRETSWHHGAGPNSGTRPDG
ncbi:metal ABC transporter permease [Acidithiobacillus sp.]|uniref:metal ABC transporter permease n=1 Tax=Acidithiobacillus sp. TaxID=1872118 RepID=UPI0025C56D13|nr:metal ABC transporter permease [Acidithiobacillus sp.]